MTAMVAATYLGFEAPQMKWVYLFLAGVAGLFFLLLVLHGLGRLRVRHIERQSAWRTFQQVAKVRGLNKAQTRVLGFLAQQARLRRPAQIMGSILIFDRCLEQVQDRGALTETQLVLLEEVRQKLVSTAEVHDAKKDRRNLERVRCAIPVRVVAIPRDELEQEFTSRELEDDTQVQAKLGELANGVEELEGQVNDISAGGLSLALAGSADLREGDFVGLVRGIADQSLDLSGMWGQVCATQEPQEGSGMVVHLRFLAYSPEQKRTIIQLVYRQQEEENKKTATRPSTSRGPGSPQKTRTKEK